MTPCFFVSCTEKDGDGVYIQQFFGDLQREVRKLLGPQRPYDGKLGEQRHTISSFSPPFRPPTGVLDCHVLVALYSEAYFASARCVREWSLFYERKRWYRQRWGHDAPSLVGVPWSMDVASLPDAVRAASTFPDSMGEVAAAGGVVELVRDIRKAELYRALLSRLAELVSAGADIPLPAMTDADVPFVQPHPALAPGIRSTSAEHVADRPTVTVGEPGDRREPRVRMRTGAGMGRVGVVIGAAPANSQPRERTRLEFYGSAPEDWQPFRPISDQPAYAIAQHKLGSIAIYDTVCYPAGNRLSEDLAHAREERRVVVILLDPWLVRSEDYQAAVRELAQRILDDHPVAGTLVVFNPSDTETESRAEELRAELRHQLLDSQPGTAARMSEVQTHEQLAAGLVPLVVRAQNALMRASPTPSAAPEGGHPVSSAGGRRPGESGGDARTKPILRRRRRNGTEQQT